MGMKTIKQIADEYGVTVQTIYRKLDKVKQVKQNGENSLTCKTKGVTCLTNDGEAYLKEIFKQFNTEPENIKKNSNGFNNTESGEIIYLREQNKILQEELIKANEHSREQSDKVISLAEQLAELNKNNQILLKQAQDKATVFLPEKIEVNSPTETENKKGLFKKIFNKNK